MIRSLIPKNSEKIFPKARRWLVVPLVAYGQTHLIHELTVEKVERTFISVVIHVLDIGIQWPVHSLSSENCFAKSLDQSVL